VEYKADRRTGDAILIDGMTLREIAGRTGISFDTLYWRYKHGRTDYESLTAGRYSVRIQREEK
jgi:DNA invertase Pin-like site-specific DNA recombinase